MRRLILIIGILFFIQPQMWGQVGLKLKNQEGYINDSPGDLKNVLQDEETGGGH